MKVVATVRTRNEERNIEHFCMSYQWADQILVADGGSKDNTVAIAERMPKTKVLPFDERIKMEGGLWRNPHGKHINFLIDWATDEEADWIIFDDCDCFPNYKVKENARNIMSNINHSFGVVMITRLYLWGKDQHFPRMAQPTKDWTPSLWAWRTNTNIRASEANPKKHEIVLDYKAMNVYSLFPPYCLLHRYCPDEETAQRKLDFYINSGQHPSMLPQLEAGGELEKLPEWARE